MKTVLPNAWTGTAIPYSPTTQERAPLRLAILSHLEFPVGEPYAGGLEMQTHILAKKLQSRGHEVDVYATAGSDATLNVIEPSTVRGVGPSDPDLQVGEYETIINRQRYLEVLFRIGAGEYDIVQNNSQDALPIALAHTLSAPLVNTLHVLPFPHLRAAALAARKHNGLHWVAISRHAARDWQPYISSSEIIYNGIDTDFWKYGRDQPSDYVIWAGRMCKEKAPHLAIEAARRAGVKILLAGQMSVPEYFEEQVRPLLNDQAIYLGALEQRELVEYIGKARAYLFTSVWEEPFGLVVAEAMACGTPIVAFRSGAMPELITPEVGTIVPKGDVPAMSAAIPQLFRLSRKACRERAVRCFGIDRMIDEYENYYYALAKQPHYL